MTNTLIVRDATPKDAEAISSLISSLASFFLAEPDNPELAASFFATITPDAIRDYITGGQFRVHVAEHVAEHVADCGSQLAGVVAVRDHSHLYHLFVADRWHRRGLASWLWSTARQVAGEAGNLGKFTVNSSLYAVSVYERFGFVATGPEVRKDGLIFVPMTLDLEVYS